METLQICYLLLFPEDGELLPDEARTAFQLKGPPYFQPIDMRVRFLEAHTVQLEGVTVSVQPQLFNRRVRLCQCLFELAEPLTTVAIARKERVEQALQQMFLPDEVRESELWEEYTVLLVGKTAVSPQQFIDTHAQHLARLVRSQNEPFSRDEEAKVLMSRLSYAAVDLTVVDWGGAVVVSPDADFQADIELFKIGSYQLLHYRLIDKRIEERLRRLRHQLARPSRRLSPLASRQQMRQLVEERVGLLLDFDRVDQELLMIGDWYTAQLYRTIIDELYLDEWKAIVKGKLDSLQEIMEVAQENLSISWSTFLDIVQLVGWLVLLIGYFVLFYLDVLQYAP